MPQLTQSPWPTLPAVEPLVVVLEQVLLVAVGRGRRPGLVERDAGADDDEEDEGPDEEEVGVAEEDDVRVVGQQEIGDPDNGR